MEVAGPGPDLQIEARDGLEVVREDLGPGIAHDVPAGIRHHAIVAMLGDSHEALPSVVLGDGIVPVSSARHRRVDSAADSQHLPTTSHLDLLDDAEVTVALSGILRTNESSTLMPDERPASQSHLEGAAH